MEICKRIIYSGRVQGVGFRYTAHGLAARFAVTGYVRNLRSGDVEVVVQGLAAEVERFLTTLEQRMGAYIADRKTQDQTPEEFEGFNIRV